MSSIPDLIDEGAVQKFIDERVAEALNDYVNGTEAPVEDAVGYCDLNADQFPCSEDSIVLVSLGLAASGLSLIMVVFLMNQVRGTIYCSRIP